LHGDVGGIYLPFLRAYERSLMKTEVEKAKTAFRLPKPLANN
jgi:cellobiose-specific phosphotransferase system component IIC